MKLESSMLLKINNAIFVLAESLLTLVLEIGTKLHQNMLLNTFVVFVCSTTLTKCRQYWDCSICTY